MNAKIKTIIGIIIFAVFMGTAYFAYNNLVDKYKPNNEIKRDAEINKEDKNNKKMAALDFTVVDVEGKKVKLSDFIGKPIVLNFWASWCPPCKGEMPHFNKVYAGVKNDVVFIMVDLVDGQRETLDKGKKYIKDNGYTFPVYFDTEEQAAENYGISAIPSTFFIDKTGKIVKSYQGGIDEKTLIESIKLITED